MLELQENWSAYRSSWNTFRGENILRDFDNYYLWALPALISAYQRPWGGLLIMSHLSVYQSAVLLAFVTCTNGDQCNVSYTLHVWSPRFSVPFTQAKLIVKSHEVINVWPSGIFRHGFHDLKVGTLTRFYGKVFASSQLCRLNLMTDTDRRK